MPSPKTLLPARPLLGAACTLISLAAGAALAAGGDTPTPVPFPNRLVFRWERPQPVPTGLRPRDVETNSLIRADQARNTYNVTGAGLTAAILDTGLNLKHNDFKGKIVAQHNFTSDNGGNPNDATDGDGHGSNVAGVMLAGGSPHTGVAPGAKVIPLKILTNEGTGNSGTIATALQWVLDHRVQYHISVVNLSLGDGGNYQDDSNLNGDPIQAKIQALRGLGVPVCCAAGNEYHTFEAHGMGSPAIFRESISVGAVYDANIGPVTYQDGAKANSTAADRICPFSQRLHESVSADCRTDIFAPGAALTSAGPNGTSSSTVMHGTSQATPVVAGAILLLQSYYSKQNGGALPSVSQLERWLRAGAVSINDGDNEDDNVQHTHLNFPRLDVVAAIQQLIADQGSTSYSISGKIAVGATGLSGVTVAAGEESVQTRADGTYTLPGLLPGDYTVTPSRVGYSFTPSSTSVSIAGTSATSVNFGAVSLGNPPKAPNALQVTKLTRNTCTLRWKDRSLNETSFSIEGRMKNTTFLAFGSLPANSTGVMVTGLDPHTKYYFRVRAFDAAGPSGYTNTVNVITKGPAPR